jgi:RNA polymerase sigma-70 factor, ECF subfamily
MNVSPSCPTVIATPIPRSPLIASDAKSFQAHLVALVPELRVRARRLARCETIADDLVQDTIERAMRFSSQYQNGTNLRGWVQQILFSVFVTRYRRQRRERSALSRLALDPSAWPQRDPFAALSAEMKLTPKTQARLSALPTGFRNAIRMVDIESYSYREAADTLQVPVGTVMSRLHRGRKLLAEMFQAEAA